MLASKLPLAGPLPLPPPPAAAPPAAAEPELRSGSAAGPVLRAPVGRPQKPEISSARVSISSAALAEATVCAIMLVTPMPSLARPESCSRGGRAWVGGWWWWWVVGGCVWGGASVGSACSGT